MHTVRSLHDEAMELAQLALVARQTGTWRGQQPSRGRRLGVRHRRTI